MWAALIVNYGLPALAWAKDHWRDVGCGMAILFIFLYFRTSGQLSACRDAMAHPSKLDQTQASSVSGSTQVRVVFKPVPCPTLTIDGKTCPPCNCPEVDIQATADYTAAIEQAQHLADSISQVGQAKNGIWLGAGYFNMPVAQVDLQMGNWKANALIGWSEPNVIYGGVLSRKLCEW